MEKIEVPDEATRLYVKVTLNVSEEGKETPSEVRIGSRTWKVTNVFSITPVALSPRQQAIRRYSIVIAGSEHYLWREGKRWFVVPTRPIRHK